MGIENLKKWPKGTSGNPSGRPRGAVSFRIAVRRQWRKAWRDSGKRAGDLVINTLFELAIGGELKAIELIARSLDDKLRPQFNLSGEAPGGSVTFILPADCQAQIEGEAATQEPEEARLPRRGGLFGGAGDSEGAR